MALEKLPFGTQLGTAPGGVAAYSSDYDTASSEDYPSRKSFRSYYDGIYMGYKWQCVEFARRWSYINFGYIFDDVAMAYDIFELRNVRHVKNNEVLPFNAFANGSLKRPQFGSLLIWQEGGEFERTGHVAVVTEVADDHIRIAEQNVDHATWPDGRNYSRRLTAKVSDCGEYWITCSFGDAEILGWMIQTDDDEHAELGDVDIGELTVIKSREANSTKALKKSWLNIANKDEEAFVAAMGGHCLTNKEQDQKRYFVISKSAYDELADATNELHSMFMHATDYVLEHDDLLDKFNLPAAILPKIKQSWDNRLTEVITSRFDFAVTREGIKVYEYNCDSASCYMEAAKVQGKWARHYGVNEGLDAGQGLFADLVKAWKKSQAKGLVHILRDKDPEEKYHAYFMLQAIEASGLRCTMIDDLSELRWNESDQIIDRNGEVVRWVWKTWAWETALDQIRDICKGYDGDAYQPAAQHGQSVELSDVLFHKEIMVFEPLWSLIPSNKSILPVLWMLFPNHPLLLRASFELTEELAQEGYVEKPIVGRCGSNIAIYDQDNTMLESTAGQFARQDMIYQQLFKLPQVGDFYTQVCTFTARGVFAGVGVRADNSLIINKDSDCLALRVVDDHQFASHW